MKKLFNFILFFITISTYSQEALDIIAKETCSCAEKKNLDLTKESNLKEIQIVLGLCIIDSYSNHKSKFSKKELASFEGKDGLRNLGEKVAMNMVSYCPDVIMAMGRKYIDDKEDCQSKETIKADPLIVTPKITGEISAIETKQFVTIKVKDENNRNHSLLLLDYFETASLFTEGIIKTGTKLTVGYSEVEFYDPETKDFKYYKIIKSLQII